MSNIRKLLLLTVIQHSGVDGILDRVAELDGEAASKKSFGAWGEKEIVHKKNILKNLMSNTEAHMIICFRAKTEYVMEMNSKGKMAPRAVGLKEDMQADVRYEFDAVISIDKDTHEAEIVKDRIGFYELRETSDNPTGPLTIEDGKILAKLASEGLSLAEVAKRKVDTMINYILKAKSQNSSIVKNLEVRLKVQFTKENLLKFSYDNLCKIVKALQ